MIRLYYSPMRRARTRREQTAKTTTQRDAPKSMNLSDNARVLLMKTTKVSELERERTARRKVLTLEHNDTLGSALETLKKHNILSAPVVITADALDTHLPDVDTNDAPLDTLVGFFDVRDAVAALMGAVSSSPEVDENHEHSMLFWMRAIERVEKEIVDTPLIKIVGYDSELMYTPNASATSVYDLIVQGFFGGGERSIVHRVVLFEANGSLSRMVSQTDVVEWLAVHDCKLPHSLETRTIRELGFGSDRRRADFVQVDASAPTIECFRTLSKCNVSGAAVVDGNGRVIGDITSADLRSLTREHFSVVGLPVAEFIALMHGTSYAGYAVGDETRKFTSAFFEKSRSFKRERLAIDPRRAHELGKDDDRAGVFTVTLDDEFRYDWFSKLNKQRVYVVEETGEIPIDVITLTDVLECATFGRVKVGEHRHR